MVAADARAEEETRHLPELARSKAAQGAWQHSGQRKDDVAFAPEPETASEWPHRPLGTDRRERALEPFEGVEASEEALAAQARSCVSLLRAKDDWEQQAAGLEALQRLAVFAPQTLAADPSLYKTLLGWAVRSVGSLRSALSKRAAQTLSELFARLGPELNAPLTELLVPALMKRASDNTSAFIRQHARTALHAFCTKCASCEALRQLERFLAHANAGLRETALLALHDCLVAAPQLLKSTAGGDDRGPGLGEAVRTALQDANPLVRKAADRLHHVLAHDRNPGPPTALVSRDGPQRGPGNHVARASSGQKETRSARSAASRKAAAKPSFLPVLHAKRGPQASREDSPASSIAGPPSSRVSRIAASPRRTPVARSPPKSSRPPTMIPSLRTTAPRSGNEENPSFSMDTWRRRRAENQRLSPIRRLPSSPVHGRPSRQRPRPPQGQAQAQGQGQALTRSQFQLPAQAQLRREQHERRQSPLEASNARTPELAQSPDAAAASGDYCGRNEFADVDRDDMARFRFDYSVPAPPKTRPSPPSVDPRAGAHAAAQAAVRPVVLRGIVTPADLQQQRARDASDDIWGPVPETEILGNHEMQHAAGTDPLPANMAVFDHQEMSLWQEIAELDQRLSSVRARTNLRHVRVANGVDGLPPELGLSPAGAAIYADVVASAPSYGPAQQIKLRKRGKKRS